MSLDFTFTERASLKGSDTEWLKTLLRSGASKDKINAMALLASESALHNLHSLSILVENFISSNRRDSVMVLGRIRFIRLL